MIGPIKDGLRKDLRPFAIAEDAFDNLTNAYQYRGRIVRRLGYTKLGRLANGTPVMGLRTQENYAVNQQTLIAFDITDAYKWNGTSFIALPSVMTTTWSGTDYQFFNTINYAGAFWATNSKPGLHGFAVNAFGVNSVTTTTANTFQVNDLIYFLNVTGPAAANNLRSAIVTVAGNPVTIVATDGGGAFTAGAATTGIALSTTRSIAGQDGIRYYGILTNGTGWANYNPPLNPFTTLVGCLLMFSYRGYLVFLNTTEGNEQGVFNYGNRARWTQIGTPYYSSPAPIIPSVQGIDPLAARDDVFGRGGADDAPTSEVIIGADFIRDILIVYFERSTWRLRFVNNSQNPFVWERINVEFGSDSTFSTIVFDKGLMAIGNRGIVISDGNDTSRIDQKIPDSAFDIRQTNNGTERVYGIRTFKTRLNYWTYPSASNPSGKYPDQVLVFNYETQNWSYFDDVFTCFGYYYNSGSGYTWGDLDQEWSSYTNLSWGSGVSEGGFESIVAGNQQGYVLLLEQGMTNGPSLSISAITAASTGVFTSTNSYLFDGSWITLSGVTGTTSDDGVSLNGRNFKVSNPTQDINDFTLNEFEPIVASDATGAAYTYTISFQNLIAGSIQINIGVLIFTDPNVDGTLVEAAGLGSGTINYSTGKIDLTFNPAIATTAVNIRIVSLDPLQGIDVVSTIGVYGGGGEIAKISNIDIQTKIFNFFNDDKGARLSKIDFYTNATENGQFTVNVFGDSSNEVINTPMPDNPLSNVVLTSPAPYQTGIGDQSVYRLYCDSLAQTVQVQITLSDAQMATDHINGSDIQILAMMFTLRRTGRLP